MWMPALLLKVLNMSVTAGIVIILVLAARILLKKAPKIFSYALWAVVLFRLVCPVSFSSPVSIFGLFPALASTPNSSTYGSKSYIPSDVVDRSSLQIDLTAPENDVTINTAVPQGGVQASADTAEGWMTAAPFLWLSGVAALLIHSVSSLIRLRRKLIGAVRLHDNIYLADHIASPFVLGLFRPKIYLPSALRDDERRYVILHEQTHIRRLDHIFKMLAFLALAAHWFNPLVWVGFACCVKDMEMSCDERVLKQMGSDIKGAYGASLLSLATGRRLINGTPLAFGEGNIKGRIKNIMRFKKPAAWVIAVSLLLVAALSVGFAANEAIDRTDPDGYKSLFRERFADVRKIGLHFTAKSCMNKEDKPAFNDGNADFYKCEHYNSREELRSAISEIFTNEPAGGLYTLLDSNAFFDMNGGLYIAPSLLLDASVWQIEDTVTFKGQTADTFLWDSLTVMDAEDSRISYTLDMYQTYTGGPVKSVFILVKGADDAWRFEECFGVANNMMVAFVDETLSETEARALQSKIEQNPNVEYAEFVTQEEAMKRFESKYADKSLFEGIDPSVLRHRYDIYMRDISPAEQTAKDISKIAGIAKISVVASATA